VVEFKEILQRNNAKYRLAMDEVNEQAMYRPRKWVQSKMPGGTELKLCEKPSASHSVSQKKMRAAAEVRKQPPIISPIKPRGDMFRTMPKAPIEELQMLAKVDVQFVTALTTFLSDKAVSDTASVTYGDLAQRRDEAGVQEYNKAILEYLTINWFVIWKEFRAAKLPNTSEIVQLMRSAIDKKANEFEKGSEDVEVDDFESDSEDDPLERTTLFGNIKLGKAVDIDDDKLYNRYEDEGGSIYLLPFNLNDRNLQSFIDSLSDHRAAMCNFIYQRLSDQLYEKITLQVEFAEVLRKNNSLDFYRVVIDLCTTLRSDDAGTTDLMEFHTLRCGKDITGTFTTSYPDFLQQWQAKLRVLNMIPELKPNPTMLLFQFQIAIMGDQMFKDVISDIARQKIQSYEDAKKECDIVYTAFERKQNLKRQLLTAAKPQSRYDKYMQIKREEYNTGKQKSSGGSQPEGEKVMAVTSQQPACKRGCKFHPPHINDTNCWSKNSTCGDCNEKGHKTGAPMCKKRKNPSESNAVVTDENKLSRGEKRRIKIANQVEERANALLEERLNSMNDMESSSSNNSAMSTMQHMSIPRPSQSGKAPTSSSLSGNNDSDDNNANRRILNYWNTGSTNSKPSIRCLYDSSTHELVAGLAAKKGLAEGADAIALIDSGCSAHVISSPSLLTESMKVSDETKIKFGCETANGQTYPTHIGYILGLGKAMVLPSRGNDRPLNLISEALLIANGVYIKTGPRGKELYADEDLTLHLITVPPINNIYPVALNALQEAMHDAQTINEMRAKDQLSDENAQFNFAHFVGAINTERVAELPKDWETYFYSGPKTFSETDNHSLVAFPAAATKEDNDSSKIGTVKPDLQPSRPEINLYYSKREFNRAWAAYQLHQLNHMSYEALANAVENGHIINTNLTRKDFDNALTIYGPCAACLAAKFRYPSLNADPRGTTMKGEIVAIDLLPVDQPQIGGYTYYIVSVDEYTKYIFLVGIKSKDTQRHLVAGLNRLRSHYLTRGNCQIQRFHPDSEACLLACEDAVNAINLPFDPSPPHIKQKQVERQVQTIKGRMRAIELSMDKELPEYLRGQILIAMAQEHNRLPELESGRPSPDVLFLGERFDMAVHHPLPFGTPVVVYYPDHGSKTAMAASMSTQSYGIQKFYVRETHRLVVRHHKMVRQIDNIPADWNWTPRVKLKVIRIRDSDHAQRQRKQRQRSSRVIAVDEGASESDDDITDDEEMGSTPRDATTIDDADAEQYSRECDTDEENRRAHGDLSETAAPPTIIDPGGNTLASRRSERLRRPISQHRNEYQYQCLEDGINTLRNIEQANKLVYRMSYKKGKLKYPKESVESMEKEIKNLLDHDVGDPILWSEIMSRNESKHILDVLAFQLEKFDHATQKLLKLKSRVCIMGNNQPEVTFDQVYSPTVSAFISNVLLYLAARACGKLFCCLIDVVGAWLNTWIPVEHPRMYMRVPPDLAQIFLKYRPEWSNFLDRTGCLYLQMKKFVYGLKQAGREYKKAFDGYVIDFGFQRSPTDECLYYYTKGDVRLIMSVHGDDNLIIGNNLPILGEFIDFLAANYEEPSVQLWPTNYCGAALQWDLPNGLVYKHMAGKLQQSLEKLGYDNLRPVDIPYTADLFESDPGSAPADRGHFMSGTMSFLWPSRVCRLDTNMPVAFLTTKNVKPTQQDVKKLKTVAAYYAGTLRYGLQLGEPNYQGDPFTLSFTGLSDAGHGTHSDGKSHGGFFIRVGDEKSYIYVECGKIQVITLSACDAETYIQVKCAKQLCFFETTFKQIGLTVLVSKLYTDSLSGIKYFLREKPNRRMIHSIIRNNFLKQLIMRGQIMMKWKPTGELEPDILTKVLVRLDFLYKRDKVMVNVPLNN